MNLIFNAGSAKNTK